MRELLNLPERSRKPRSGGVTHVIDRGLSTAEIDGMIEVAGEFIDIVKLGWGTALATGNLERKLERYRHHEIPVVLGGTLTELAISRGRLDELGCALEHLGAAAMVIGRRFGLQHTSPWARVNVLTRGRLLAMAPAG